MRRSYKMRPGPAREFIAPEWSSSVWIGKVAPDGDYSALAPKCATGDAPHSLTWHEIATPAGPSFEQRCEDCPFVLPIRCVHTDGCDNPTEAGEAYCVFHQCCIELYEQVGNTRGEFLPRGMIPLVGAGRGAKWDGFGVVDWTPETLARLASHQKRFRKNHPDRVRAYRARVKEKSATRMRRFYERNKDEMRARGRARYAANREKILAQKKVRDAKKRGATQECAA